MDRRTAILAGVSMLPAIPTGLMGAVAIGNKQALDECRQRERPWAKRAEELEPVEGHWADYAAWQEWLSRKMGDIFQDDSLWDDITNSCYLTPIALYVLFCRAYDGDENTLKRREARG